MPTLRLPDLFALVTLSAPLRAQRAAPSDFAAKLTDEANRRNFAQMAATFHETVMQIVGKDRTRWNQHVMTVR